MNRVKREAFIEEYVAWIRFRLAGVLPAEAPKYRMVELTRRQHHSSVADLAASMEALPRAVPANR